MTIRLLDLGPPAGTAIVMYPRGHISQGHHYMLQYDSSSEGQIKAWLQDMLVKLQNQPTAPKAVQAAKVEVLDKKSGDVINIDQSSMEPYFIDGKRVKISSEIHPLLVTQQDRMICATCGHNHRTHEEGGGACRHECECQKFEIAFE